MTKKQSKTLRKFLYIDDMELISQIIADEIESNLQYGFDDDEKDRKLKFTTSRKINQMTPGDIVIFAELNGEETREFAITITPVGI